jgi:hypothetical protein
MALHGGHEAIFERHITKGGYIARRKSIDAG